MLLPVSRGNTSLWLAQHNGGKALAPPIAIGRCLKGLAAPNWR